MASTTDPGLTRMSATLEREGYKRRLHLHGFYRKEAIAALDCLPLLTATLEIFPGIGAAT